MSEWSQIKLIEMLVSKSELQIESKNNTNIIFLSCDLLNIARGRCDIIINKIENSNLKNYISIIKAKPIMNANINLNSSEFESILLTMNSFVNYKSKKIKIAFYLNKSLAVNNDGFLSIENDIKLEIINFKIILPVI
tara:strand:+ start:950 stop:1360 length:411 start_codon:yes stop_codon:yes gene_type:complete